MIKGKKHSQEMMAKIIPWLKHISVSNSMALKCLPFSGEDSPHCFGGDSRHVNKTTTPHATRT